METILTNPTKKRKRHAKRITATAAPTKRRRRNPMEPLINGKRRGKRRGSARRGVMRNPGFGSFMPGAGGGLLFRLGLRKVGGEKVRAADGKLTGTGYGIGAAMLYFADDIAGFLGFNGAVEQAAFGGGMSAIAGSLAVDEHLPDLASEHLYPMTGAPKPEAPAAGGKGVSGLGASPGAPMSRDAYAALAGMGQDALQALGPVVYVTGADGNVYSVPTSSQGVSGPAAETVDLPSWAKPGDVIRNKVSKQAFRVTDIGAGRLGVVPLGMSGDLSSYVSATY